MIVPRPIDERERLLDLHSYNVLNTEAESDYDEITHLASAICEVPVSLITLIDENSQWVKSRVGVGSLEIDRNTAFCSYAILQNNLMIVPDMTKDDRFKNNPLVTGSHKVKFYAGMPLVTPAGFKLGTLCVLDNVPHELSDRQKLALQTLSKHVIKLLELKKRNLQLKRLGEVNSRLLSIIGHDLRAPFNSLYGLLSISENNEISMEEFNEFIPKIKKAVDSGSALLINLLEWASSQIGGQMIRKEKISLKTIIDNIISENSQLLSEKTNTTITKIKGDDEVFADQKMIEFIIRNLLLNANKFTENGTISFSSRVDGNLMEIKIEDTGVGIPDSIVENLFSWETRVSDEGTKGEKGSGLGLLFCSEFVEAHGGRLWVKTKLNEGSSFFFTLPN